MAALPPDAAQTIKKAALRGGATVCGIAAADAFDAHAPAGHRPGDLLPGARSVIVVGGSQPRAGDWRATSPAVLHSMGTTERIQSVGRKLAQSIESEFGYYALYVPPGTASGDTPFLSFMLAAELAGVGSRSLAAHIILNPEYGLLYYAALITTLPLTPDPPLDKPACLNAGCAAMYKRIGTTPCLRVCPACLNGTVKDGAIETSTYDREKCHSRAQTYGIGSFQKGLLAIVNEDDADKRHTMIYGDFFTKTLLSVGFFRDSIAQCFECMRVCPVGRKHRKLR